jgi:acetylornithine/LysW-gamma-L-lysine aminotransferase
MLPTFDVNTDLNALEDAHSSGAILWDSSGSRYVDLVGGQGTANLGHCHPAVVAAVREQVGSLITCPELFHHPLRARYQAELCAATGMPRVFLCNSGAEAIEGAFKSARLATGRTAILSSMRGFHGRTLGALSATWEKTYREPFLPLLPDVSFVPYNNVEKLAAALTPNTAAFIVEAVQGEGGVHPAQPGYLQAVRDLCDANGTLLILDEVQTGFGRTGDLFAHQHDGVRPDLLCLAKSMAGGLPMGALCIGARVGALPPASHGSTFGGNPVACAAALATLDVLQHTVLIARARDLGERVLARLRANLPERAAREVRGRGLMIGIELRGKVAPVLRALQSRGVLALPAGATVLRLLPPLVIEESDLFSALDTILETLNEETNHASV